MLCWSLYSQFGQNDLVHGWGLDMKFGYCAQVRLLWWVLIYLLNCLQRIVFVYSPRVSWEICPFTRFYGYEVFHMVVYLWPRWTPCFKISFSAKNFSSLAHFKERKVKKRSSLVDDNKSHLDVFCNHKHFFNYPNVCGIVLLNEIITPVVWLAFLEWLVHLCIFFKWTPTSM